MGVFNKRPAAPAAPVTPTPTRGSRPGTVARPIYASDPCPCCDKPMVRGVCSNCAGSPPCDCQANPPEGVVWFGR